MKTFFANKFTTLLLSMTVIYSVSLSSVALSADLPPAPANCFKNGPYCTDSEIINENGRRIIKVTLHAQISGDLYSSTSEIKDLYLGFDNWEEIFKGNDVLKMVRSKALPQLEVNGKTIYRHYVDYIAPAPFPLWTQEVRMVAHYQDIVPSPFEGTDIAVRFDAITDQDHEVPGEKILHGAEGVQYQTGDLFIKFDKENNQFIAYTVTKVIPAIDLLPSIAAPYVEKSVTALFRGILNI